MVCVGQTVCTNIVEAFKALVGDQLSEVAHG